MVLNPGLRVYGLQFPARPSQLPKDPGDATVPTWFYATLRSTSPIAPLQSGACRVISSTTGKDEPSPIRRMPSAETTPIRAARGEPPVNPLGSAVGLTLGWSAASLEQSVPLTRRGRELGKRREWESDWSFIQLGTVSLRIEGLLVSPGVDLGVALADSRKENDVGVVKRVAINGYLPRMVTGGSP